ncbi:MAG: CoA pyrophosphatase [Vibrio sp.]
MNKDMFLNRFNLFAQPQYHARSLCQAPHLHQAKLRQAAVLIPLIERNQQLHVLFTHRAAHLKHHPNQVSFPGGKTEDHDTGPWDTASREAFEEIGLSASELTPLGQLPPLATISYFNVTPVIGLVDSQFQPQIDFNEVQSTFEVPLAYLLNPEHMQVHDMLINNQVHQVFSFSYKGHFIWGVTAQILHSLQTHLWLELPQT